MPLPFATPYHDEDSMAQYLAGAAAAGSMETHRRTLNQRYTFAWAIYTYVTRTATPLPTFRAAELADRLHHGLHTVRSVAMSDSGIAANLALSVLNIARELMVELVLPALEDDEANEAGYETDATTTAALTEEEEGDAS